MTTSRTAANSVINMQPVPVAQPDSGTMGGKLAGEEAPLGPLVADRTHAASFAAPDDKLAFLGGPRLSDSDEVLPPRTGAGSAVLSSPSENPRPQAAGRDPQAQAISHNHKVMLEQIDLLVAELAQPTGDDPMQAPRAQAHLCHISGAVRNLQKAGMKYEAALKAFSDATEEAFMSMPSAHEMKPAIAGMSRLAGLASVTNRDIVTRQLAQSISDPYKLHRIMITQERKNAPPPTGIAEKLVAFGLGEWRGLKEADRAKKEAKAAKKAEKIQARLASRKIGIEVQLKDLENGLGDPTERSSRIAVLLQMIASRDFGDVEINSPEGQAFLCLLEEQLMTRNTDSLNWLAGRLLDTAPGRRKFDETTNAIGKSLAAVLRMRPGGEAMGEALDRTPLSGR